METATFFFLTLHRCIDMRYKKCNKILKQSQGVRKNRQHDTGNSEMHWSLACLKACYINQGTDFIP